MEINALTRMIIGCAYKVHNTLGPGFLEKVYENALRIELEEEKLTVKQHEPLTVYYRQRPVGEFIADLIVEEKLIIEIKAVVSLIKEHEVQLVNYLTATAIEDGLLVNFGPSVQIRHKYRTYRAGTQEKPSRPD